MAAKTLSAWFGRHPEAVEAVRLWLVARQRGKSREGADAVRARLARDHGFPFRDPDKLRRWARRTFPALYETSVAEESQPASAAAAASAFKRSAGEVHRLERREDFFVTCAVQESYANRDFLSAVLRWRDEVGGILVVNPVYYVNPRTRSEAEQRRGERWWDPVLRDFLLDNELRPHPELSIMTTKAQATAHNPLPARLSGRTKDRSAVFGHPQLSMRTVATPQSKLPKILYSSGAVTEKNYSDTMAGDMAEFHHSLGGVIVEVRGDRFHLREVVWDGESFIDAGTARRYYADRTEPAPRPEALVMGDVHAPHYVDPNVMEATFGEDGIVQVLDPRRVVLHDLADNRSVNPHEIANRLTRAALAGAGESSLKEELLGVLEWLKGLPPVEEVTVVRSNHDDFLERWLQRAQPDPQNAKLFHKLSYLMLEHHEKYGEFPVPLETALSEVGEVPVNVRFLDHDESYRACGVELGMHGHLGPNGARGSLRNLSQIGTRSMFGHVHSPGIWQGAYAVGLSAVYRHGYNHGPSSWLQSHGLVHANGYRQLIHIVKSHWRG